MPKIKLQPQNTEAEEAVLGALMMDKNAVIKVADVLTPDDFYKPAHGKIYRAILTLYEKQQPVDIVSVTSKLKEAGALKEIGGSSHLVQLMDQIATASHVDHHAKVVKEKKILRDLIGAAGEITETAFTPGDDLDVLLDKVEQKIFSISQRSVANKFSHLKEELKAAYERIENLHRGEGKLRGVGTGFTGLDHYLSGMQKSDLVVLGARPSLGKTTLALDIVRHVAVKENQPVGIFSLEMSKEQVIDRLIAAESRVPLWKLRTGRLSSDIEFELIQTGLDTLSKAPIFIDDTPSPNILQMRSMARRLQVEHGLALLVIDYLQLIQPRTNSDSLVQQITEVSRGLKGLARELNVPVLALSQLSRLVDHREVKIPRLSDLRDSGCLTGDTTITRADTGEMLTIKELAQRKIQKPVPVFCLDKNWKIAIKPLIKAFSSGRKIVYELRVQSGRIIKASANHPFRKLGGWQRLDKLQLGDTIALPRILAPASPPNPLQDDELILLAHLIGDGCVLPNQPLHYTSADWSNILTVNSVADSLFGIKSRIVKQENWWHIYLPSPYRLARGKHHPIINWFKKLSIEPRRSYEKIAPPSLFQCSKEKIALFLRHLWSTDGNISWKKSKNRKPAAAVYYATTSPRLAVQVQHLLLRFGINGRLTRVNQKKYRPIFQIHVQGSQNQLRFLKEIGCSGKRGEIIPELVAALDEITPNPNTDIISREAWQLLIEPAKTAVGLGWRGICSGIEAAYCGTTLFKSGISRERMARLAAVCQNQDLKKLSISDAYWDKITSITPLGKEDVYDATIEDEHNFVANDIFVHNSIEQDSDVVLFIYRKDREKINPDPEEENTAEIIIAKHRNGPLGSVRLKFDQEKVSFLNIDSAHSA